MTWVVSPTLEGTRLIKGSPSGTVVWNRNVGTADRRIKGWEIALDSVDNVHVGFLSVDPTDRIMDFGVAKYASNGFLNWSRRYNGSSNLFDGATDIAIAPDENVLVTGSQFWRRST